MKKRFLRATILILSVIVIIILYFSLTGFPQKKREIENEVQVYLTSKRAYNNSDIKKIEGMYSFKTKKYQVNVIFTDEPKINYTYEKVNNTFKLVGTSNLNGRHMDETFDE